MCKEHKFKIGNKLLLKRRKLNKWSPTHEKEYFRIIGIQDSSIRARRNSDGHTVRRDASKFKQFFKYKGEIGEKGYCAHPTGNSRRPRTAQKGREMCRITKNNKKRKGTKTRMVTKKTRDKH